MVPSKNKSDMNNLDVNLNYDLGFDPSLYYRTGNYFFNKCGNFYYTSSLMFFLVKNLDNDPNVKNLYVRKFPFKYFHPLKNSFCSDFYDVSTENTHYYISSQHFLNTQLENSRIYAAKIQSDKNFVVITEPDLFGNNPNYMKSLIDFFKI